jgi:hypothetical protein
MVAVGLGVVLFVGLFTGAATGAVPDQRPVIRLDDADNGRNITARPNEDIIVSIRNCFSCRYRWDVSQAPDAQVVAFRSDEDQRAPAGSPDGAPEYRRFTFEAVGGGETALTLSYYPPASPSGAGRPESTYRLSFTVSGPVQAVSPSVVAAATSPGAPPLSAPPPAPAPAATPPPVPARAAAQAPAPAPAVTPPPVPAAVPAPAGETIVLGPTLPGGSEALGPPVPTVPPRLASIHDVARSGPVGNRGILFLGVAIILGGVVLYTDGFLGVKRH